MQQSVPGHSVLAAAVRYTFLTNMGDISLVTLERAMRAKPVPHAHGKSSVGRALVFAIIFISGMYAIAATLIGMV